MTAINPRVAGRAAESVPDTVARLRATYARGRTRSLSWRRAQLQAIVRLVTEREADLAAAIRADLGRGEFDSWLADFAPVAAEARHALKKLRAWTRPTRVRTPFGLAPARARHQPEPLGVVLIIAPWNYPVQLLLAPLVGAVAAGNCAILKPSERTPACSALLADLVPRYLDADAVAVVEGTATETLDLLDQDLDHCLFTGSAEVGQAVMTAAAKHLTPVTLELGGKSPVLIARDADLTVAARRLAWAKAFNSGQTCIAPDYVLVDHAVRDAFITELSKALDAAASEPDLIVVDERHADRMARLIDNSEGKVVRGGTVVRGSRRVQLTIVLDPRPDSALMTEEIFGPVLPIVTVDSIDDAISYVNRGAKPLALYVFSGNKATVKAVTDRTSSGSVVVNHLLYQLLVTGLPFGGVGGSGSGAYHGRWGFNTFSHHKAVLSKPTRPDPSLAYPPYTRIKQRVLRALF